MKNRKRKELKKNGLCSVGGKECCFKSCRVPIRTHNLPIRTATAISALGRTARVQTQ
jgi:hypothetical protein